MAYFLAAFPILLILFLMVFFRWGGQRAGPAGWLAGVLVAALGFGLNFDVWWVSQARGLLLSFFVLAVLWPALFLYHVVDGAGGIRAMALGLESRFRDRALLLVVVAWAFSGMLEGLAGFGLPIAVVAPMLVALGVAPVLSVAAVAVGHAWAVTFGDMGVVFQTLVAVSQVDGSSLIGPAAAILGVACLVCGLAAARILDQRGVAWKIVLLAVGMAVIQYGVAAVGLGPLAGLAAGLTGVVGGLLMSRKLTVDPLSLQDRAALRFAFGSYGGLALLMTVLALPGPHHQWLDGLAWRPVFPQVSTLTGFVTAAGPGTVLKFLLHPGTAILLVACIAIFVVSGSRQARVENWRRVVQATWHSAAPASMGIIATVGLSTLMDHCGMTLLLAQGLSGLMQAAYPVVSPLVGMLGAFATGSNNNSNVLFASLQKNAALILGMDPRWLLAAQTAGGSLGSMIAPAKIIVGCSTVGLKGKDGAVLRITLPVGILIGIGVGVFVWLASRL